jgi:hypothetical protein
VMRCDTLEALSIKAPEKVAYVTALLGMLGDQLSTRLGLSRSMIYEANPNAAWLISNNLWLPFDLLVSASSVALTALFLRRCQAEGRWVMLSFPLILGGTRLLSTFMNLLLYLSV